MSDSVGKGVAYLTAANVAFILAGFAVSFGLAWLLPVADFGVYGVVMSIISTVNIIFVNGFQQAVSKFVSEDSASAAAVKKSIMRFVFLSSLVVFTLIVLSAPLIAGLFNDSSLALPIQIVAFVILTQAIYAVYFGYLNGLRLFKRQGWLRI
ncbi:MAG: oligosaccharide flippase family protein, partial [Candidatus Diapherotrites archaeon]|nr:oligosaccharide flippase family protein [Candidatus Diapherotrites archaeon]